MTDAPAVPQKDTPHWAAKQADQLRLQAETFRRIYANNFGIGISNWDASFVFGEIVGEKEGEPVIEEKVKVIVPLPLLKAMTQLLSANLASYENQFGEIQIPKLRDLNVANPFEEQREPEPPPKSEAED